MRFHTGSRERQEAARNLLIVAVVLLNQLAVVFALHLLPGLSQLLTHHTHRFWLRVQSVQLDPVSPLRGERATSQVSHQVVDDVEAVVLAVVGVDAAVGLLPHVVFQCCFVPEGFLAVQTL